MFGQSIVTLSNTLQHEEFLLNLLYPNIVSTCDTRTWMISTSWGCSAQAGWGFWAFYPWPKMLQFPWPLVDSEFFSLRLANIKFMRSLRVDVVGSVQDEWCKSTLILLMLSSFPCCPVTDHSQGIKLHHPKLLWIPFIHTILGPYYSNSNLQW